MAQARQDINGGQLVPEEPPGVDELQHIEEMIRERRSQRRVEVAPTTQQRLGRLTIVGLILNRTIGTGIFAQPSNVLYLTGSPALAVILWIVGGLIILAVTLSWIELGLTVPRHYIPSRGAFFWTPRSGGDKNYLEYIYKRPHQWMSCVFGVTFILFGNLAGNAIQFGIYMQNAISPHCNEGDPCYNKVAVIFWAIAILCLCSLLNICTRKIFIGLINAFAIVKLLLLIATAFLGIIYGTTHGDGCRTNIAWANQGPGGQFGDIALAMFYGMYSYTGFEQPFYVLAEIKQPKRYFDKYVLLALASVLILFPLTNVGFLCVVPYTGSESVPENMALAFFDIIARGGNPTADTTGSQQAVSVVLAIVIFGTIMSQTFTGTLVKQEIGKEAIIPFSKYIAQGSDSLLARYLVPSARRSRQTNPNYIEDHPEQVPMAATVVHLVFAVLLVVIVGPTTKLSTAYRLLTYLRVFSIIVVLGMLTVLGLLYLKIDSWWHGIRSPPRPRHNEASENGAAVDNYEMQQQHQRQSEDEDGGMEGQNRGRRWLEKRQWWPWLDPLPTVVACLALVFLGFATCVSPTQIRESERSLPYWIHPLVGWLIPFVGTLWWLGLRYWQWWTRETTVVKRLPDVRVVGGEAVMRAEVIEFVKMNTRDARRL